MANRRGSKQRDLILEIIQKTDIHPTADWIYDQARKVIPNISLGTVYRNLKLLKEEGLIQEVIVQGSSSARYDANLVPHYHFICLKCNTIYDIAIQEENTVTEIFQKEKKFKIEFIKIDILGICDKCLPQNEP